MRLRRRRRARLACAYVALGASDAVGVGASNQNTTAYVPILISRLPKGDTALNLGISGETLHGALSDELPTAIQAQPTLITVWLVGNDFKDCVPLNQYTADLNTLLTQLQTKTQRQSICRQRAGLQPAPRHSAGRRRWLVLWWTANPGRHPR